jgi:hypothetical protein
MYNVVFKTIGYWRFYWGSWNGFQNAGRWNLCSYLWLDGFGKSLETASCCKTDADGKTYDAFADANKGTVVVTWI